MGTMGSGVAMSWTIPSPVSWLRQGIWYHKRLLDSGGLALFGQRNCLWFLGFCAGDARECRRSGEGIEGRSTIESIDCITDGCLDCLCVAHVKSVEFGIRVSEFRRVLSSRGSPECRLSIPEGSQS